MLVVLLFLERFKTVFLALAELTPQHVQLRLPKQQVELELVVAALLVKGLLKAIHRFLEVFLSVLGLLQQQLPELLIRMILEILCNF